MPCACPTTCPRSCLLYTSELDGIVGVLESNSLELEDSLRSYERGVALLAALQGLSLIHI